jgi:hypothetical protein
VEVSGEEQSISGLGGFALVQQTNNANLPLQRDVPDHGSVKLQMGF